MATCLPTVQPTVRPTLSLPYHHCCRCRHCYCRCCYHQNQWAKGVVSATLKKNSQVVDNPFFFFFLQVRCASSSKTDLHNHTWTSIYLFIYLSTKFFIKKKEKKKTQQKKATTKKKNVRFFKYPPLFFFSFAVFFFCLFLGEIVSFCFFTQKQILFTLGKTESPEKKITPLIHPQKNWFLYLHKKKTIARVLKHTLSFFFNYFLIINFLSEFLRRPCVILRRACAYILTFLWPLPLS